tara:strand:+ start:114 stop:503 length:390 start_codon:yes stop_codon:yes gene_type:complete
MTSYQTLRNIVESSKHQREGVKKGFIPSTHLELVLLSPTKDKVKALGDFQNECHQASRVLQTAYGSQNVGSPRICSSGDRFIGIMSVYLDKHIADAAARSVGNTGKKLVEDHPTIDVADIMVRSTGYHS